MIITHPSGYDYQLWQQHFPAMQPTYSNPNVLNGAIPHDPTASMNSNLINSLSKNSQQSYREYDPRSLLGKYVFLMFQIEPNILPVVYSSFIFLSESYEMIMV